MIPELFLDIDGCENLWLKLNDADVVISAIYRHPKNNSKLFLDHLNNSLAHNMPKNTKVYLVGDFNIDIASNFASDYINLLASNGYFPLVTLPTRVTETSSTVIDHIITNDHKHSIIPGIIKSDLTDHYPIFCSIKLRFLPNKKSEPSMFQRDLHNFNKNAYCDDLHKSLYNFFLINNNFNHDNFNKLFSDFIEIIKSAIDHHAPFKKLSRRQRKLKQKPWISSS